MKVRAVGHAPVKGTRHTSYDAVALDALGPVGDRAFCLVDVDRRSVMRSVRNPRLVQVRAAWDGTTLVLDLPDGGTVAAEPEPTGETVTCDYWGREVALDLLDGPHAVALSAHLGREARLAAAPRSAVVYGAPVSVVGTASLRDLGQRARRDDLLETVARFRMTMVVETDQPYVEDTWAGHELRVGGATLAVRRPVPRCAVVDRDPRTGAKDGSLVKVLSGYRPSTGGEPWLGVDATVVGPAVVRPGDAVEAAVTSPQP